MQKRMLGKSGITVPEIGFGCMGMSEFYGPSDDEASRRTLAHAVQLGVAFFDTQALQRGIASLGDIGRAVIHTPFIFAGFAHDTEFGGHHKAAAL
ncbi:MAG: hypothetical protein P8Y36_11215, partial [Alphaproteobacteria bacterium]